MVSLYQEVVPGVALLANVGWQNWSQFGKVDIQIANAAQSSATVNVNYKDTWHAALGAQIQVAPGWLLSTGISYDSSMVSDGDRGPALPVGSAFRIAAGIQHPVSESVELGFAYEFLWGGNLPVDKDRGPLSGRIAGSYNNTNLNFFALNVNWKL
jgi:long-chain fatty acid transport protein